MIIFTSSNTIFTNERNCIIISTYFWEKPFQDAFLALTEISSVILKDVINSVWLIGQMTGVLRIRIHCCIDYRKYLLTHSHIYHISLADYKTETQSILNYSQPSNLIMNIKKTFLVSLLEFVAGATSSNITTKGKK